MSVDPIQALRDYVKPPEFTPEFCEALLRATLIEGGAFIKLNPNLKPEMITMSEAYNEDTTKIDIELIANDLELVAKTAGRLNQTDIATEIGALVAKYREQARGMEA